MNLIGKIERERMIRRAQKKVDKARQQAYLQKKRDNEFRLELKERGLNLTDLESLQ